MTAFVLTASVFPALLLFVAFALPLFSASALLWMLGCGVGLEVFSDFALPLLADFAPPLLADFAPPLFADFALPLFADFAPRFLLL